MTAPPTTPPARQLMKWPDLLKRPRPEPDETLSYGDSALQVVDLWLPKRRGRHPVVVMVHGGCWQSDVADRRIMNWIANDLRHRGIAVWNIDYRGVDRPGGGYPGTYEDVVAAMNLLYFYPEYHLDLSRVVAVGHSAGGHLAMWLAGWHRIPAGMVTHRRLPDGRASLEPAPPRVAKVISLGGLQDLDEAARPPGSGCGVDVVNKIAGNHWTDTSVPRLAPLGVPQTLINGADDKIIPPAYADIYKRKMEAAGDKVSVRMIAHTGHVELIAPESPAWAAAVEEIEAAFRK